MKKTQFRANQSRHGNPSGHNDQLGVVKDIPIGAYSGIGFYAFRHRVPSLNRTKSVPRKSGLSSVVSKRRDPSCHVTSARKALPIVRSKLRLQTAFLTVCRRNPTYIYFMIK
ncbi:hypothetical protein AVEN_139268-1 [Araneus ventricosus]|uniref:Uncharacterized protein n=1 Tax=Araneus ventricosus TaxID=182803 RepID=A0A4Y2MGP4_ARAVE|nr:hypothetical protein AVEN_139268-1 [Araneus ventricosus]